MEKRNKISALDGIVSLQVSNQKSGFPEHFHETYCISLIESGLETIKMGDTTIYTEKGHISINNPFEVHSNPLVRESTENSFTTLYLSSDLVDTLLGEKSRTFHHQQIIQSDQIQHFKKIANSLSCNKTDNLEKSLKQFLKSLATEPKAVLEDSIQLTSRWSELILFIDNHLDHKISLDFLSKFMGKDKYNFAKEFRQKIGLSPYNYVLMKKIFLSKRLIDSDTNLTQLAYQLDFADLAHFSKHFKRFVGISPVDYKRKL